MSYASLENCWQNIVGVRGCGDVTPDIYLNELGIDQKELNSIAGSDYDTGRDLLEEKISIAIKEVAYKILSNFQDKFKTTSVIHNVRVGKTQENQVEKAAANKLKGIFYELCNQDSFLDFYVSEISLQVQQTGQVLINVIDLLQGVIIDTIAVDAVAGEIVTVYPNKTYKSSRRKLQLFFGYNSTFPSIYTSISSGCCGQGYSNAFFNTNSYTIDAPYKKSSLAHIGDTGGLSMNVSVVCNHTDWLCTHRGSVALPLAYKVAAELMEYSLNKSRQESYNSANNTSAPENQSRLLTYGGKYVQMMTDLMTKMKVPSDTRCFACNQKIIHSIGI